MALGAPTLCTRPEAAAMFPGIPPVSFTEWENPDSGTRRKISNSAANGGAIPTENGVSLRLVLRGDL